MIDRISGRLVMICDECGEGLEGASGGFQELVADAKENGWAIRPSETEAGEWSHTCPDCAAPP